LDPLLDIETFEEMCKELFGAGLSANIVSKLEKTLGLAHDLKKWKWYKFI
jgi:hypothetical protein